MSDIELSCRRLATLVCASTCALAPVAGAGCPDCPWDLDDDDHVRTEDLLELLSAWGTDPGGPPDFDGGGVGLSDLLALLSRWGPCPSVFEPLVTLSHDPGGVAAAFWSEATRNVLVLGDSIPGNGAPNRLYDGIRRAWAHPAGWAGFHACATANGLTDYRDVDGVYGAGTSRGSRVVTEPALDGHYFGLPAGPLVDFDVGAGFAPGAGGLFDRLRLQPGGFDLGVVDDWLTGRPITAQMLYLYRSAPPSGGYVTDVDVGLGAGAGVLDEGSPYAFATDYDPRHGLEDVSGGESGLNLLARRHPIPTQQGAGAMRVNLRATADWTGGDDRRLAHLGFKLEGGPGSLFAGVAAQSIWNSPDHANPENLPADAEHRRYTDAEIERYLDLMYDDKTAPLYVVVVEGPEFIELDAYVEHCRLRNDRLVARWRAVGGADVRFVYLGLYRTGHDTFARRQNRAFFCLAAARTDTYYVNLYGLLGGILWDGSNTGGDQRAFAEARGWDAIAINAGTLDMSERDALDAALLHPADGAAAFFFAWVAAERIRADAGR